MSRSLSRTSLALAPSLALVALASSLALLACAGRLTGTGTSADSASEAPPDALLPFLGDWRFVSSGTLGGSEPPRGDPNRMRIAYRAGELCFMLLAPEGTTLHDGCFKLGETESGGWKWSVGPAEDGIRVHSMEGNPEAFAAEGVLIYRLLSPEDTLLIESWARIHRLGIAEDGWRGRGYSVYERVGGKRQQ